MTPTNLQPSLQLVDGCVGFPQVCKGSEAHGLRSLRSIRHHQYLDDWLLRPSCSGVGQVIPGFLQPSVSGSQTQQKMEANLRSDSAQFVPQYRHFQMETPETIRLSSKTGEWVTSLDLATHTSTSQLPQDQGSTSGSSCSVKPFSSQPCPSGWPQLHWSSPRWSGK